MFFPFVPFAAFAGEKIPDLQPPHGEIPPTFWEQYAWLVIAAVALLVIMAVVCAILWPRKKPPLIISSGVFARHALEALRNRKEDDVLLMEVSAVLRAYVVFAMGMPPIELTTAELREALKAHPKMTADLAAAITGFLEQCDRRKFAPKTAMAQVDAVGRALELVESIERNLIRLPGNEAGHLADQSKA